MALILIAALPDPLAPAPQDPQSQREPSWIEVERYRLWWKGSWIIEADVSPDGIAKFSLSFGDVVIGRRDTLVAVMELAAEWDRWL